MAEDRRFYVTDADGRLVGGVKYGPLVRVRPEWDPPAGRLELRFPDGVVVAGEIELDEQVETDFFRIRVVAGRVVRGPFADALSDFVGVPLRLVRVDDSDFATDVHPATLLSRASAERLVADRDPRRFRMLLELEGCGVFEEDTWQGRLVRAGGALLRVGGPVPRCAVTTQDPDSGVRDFDTLRAIRDVRGPRADDGKSLDCGVYAEVVESGCVRVGDRVEPV